MYEVKTELLVGNSVSSAFDSWSSNTDDPCTASWAHITCTSGSITGLDLSSLALAGTLPSMLSGVTSLESVSLGSNLFTSTLPTAWSALTGLTYLSLSSNTLSSSMPSVWSAMGELKQLNLGYNSLTGTLPALWADASGMTSLTRLIVSSNTDLCGAYPGSWTSSLVTSTGTLLGGTCAQTAGLLAVKTAVTSSWPFASGWTDATDPCTDSWSAVTCTGSVVTGLDLGFYSLAGSLAADFSKVAGLQNLKLADNA